MNPSPVAPTSQPSSYPSHGANDYQTSAAATAAAALSQQHIPTPNGNGRKRKASGTPGSRGVANLTPEQLAKKRANDREAQRAIRERTKNTIENLERRIKELESQQPFQELQKVAQERDRALQECEDLRRKLTTITNVISSGQQQQQQPNLHGEYDVFDQFIDTSWLTLDGDVELAALTAQQSPLPPLNTQQQPVLHQYQAHSAAAANGPPYGLENLHPDLRSPRSIAATHASPVYQSPTAGPNFHIDGTSLRKWSPSLEHPPLPQFAPTNGAPLEQRLPPLLHSNSSNGERLDLSYVLGPPQHDSPKTSPTTRTVSSFESSTAPEQLVSTRLPRNCSPSNPLDSLLLDFVSSCRQQLASGVPMRDVVGPDYPSFTALQDRDGAPTTGFHHPLSEVLTDILSKFPSTAQLEQLPERVAVLYIMFLVLRWQICPCESCYQRLPDWMKPVKEQLETSHPAWHDHVPWPTIRSNLIVTTHEVKFEDFFMPFMTRLCVNWPYSNEHVLISEASAMNPVFESHIRDLANWSLGRAFKSALPALIDESVRIQDARPEQ